MPRLPLAAAVAALVAAPSAAADPTYWQDVRPVLRRHCTVCHKESKLPELEVSAGLALDTPEAVRKGGRVPVLVPGKPDQSLLVTLLTSKDPKRAMPLDADPLPAETVAVVRRWVELGAPEGTKPTTDDTAIVTTAPARVRKLPVTFGGPNLEATLPVGPLPPVAAVAFSPDGQMLAAGSYGRVTLWDLAAGKPARVLTAVLGAVNDLRFSPDGKLLAVAGGQPSARGDLRLFDPADGKLVASLGGHLDTVSGVAFSPDGSRLASASFDKTVRLWDVKAAKALHTFTGHSDFVYAVAFGPKGEWYATASKDRTGRVIDAATGASRATLSGNNDELMAVAVTPAGQVVTSGAEPGFSYWDPATAERVKKQGGHAKTVTELAHGGAGLMASAGYDNLVRLWPAGGGNLSALAVPGVPFAVAVDAAGKRVAVGASDGLVRVWEVPAAGQPAARLLVTMWSGPGAGPLGAWLAITPEGYHAAADGLLAAAAWTANGKPGPTSADAAKRFDPETVGKAARGEVVAAGKGK